MHNEERERRDNRPNSAGQAAATRDRPQPSMPVSSGGRVVDTRLVSPRTAQSATVPSHTAAATAAKKKQPVYLNHDDTLRLQLNLSDIDDVGIIIIFIF